jgi:hypothetical protein
MESGLHTQPDWQTLGFKRGHTMEKIQGTLFVLTITGVLPMIVAQLLINLLLG